MVQMHQKEKLGGGIAEENIYETWTIQECDSCGRLAKEEYACRVITLEEVEALTTK